MLELKNISFMVDSEGADKEIIRDVSLTIPDRKMVVVTGPNGGGKSTLARLIAGIEKPTSGQIFLNGEDIGEFEFRNSDIVVIGNESNGISPEVAAVVTHRITIPSVVQGRDTAESLNAAVAAAVVMYQWRGGGC